MPRHTRGQAMVEFGLIALLFVLLLFGIADFGLLLNGWINVSSASSVAARQASVGVSLDEMYTSVRTSALVPGLSPCSAAAPQPCAYALKMIVTYPVSGGGTPKNHCRGFKNPASTTSYAVTVNGSSLTCEADTGVPSVSQGDAITLMVLANTFEISTPLVRPFFGCSTSQPHCFVPLKSASVIRFEGVTI